MTGRKWVRIMNNNILNNILNNEWADLIDRKLYNKKATYYDDGHRSINLLDLCEINDIERKLHDQIYNIIAEIFNDPHPDPEFDPFKPVGVDLSDLY